MKLFNKARTRRRGAALVEYGLIIAGVALVSAAALSIFGKKTSDMIGTAAAILPGATASDNAQIKSGRLIETTAGSLTDAIEIDVTEILAKRGTERLGNNLGFDGADLVVED